MARPSEDRSSHGWRARLARALELPPEVAFDLPRLMWLAGRDVVLENHRGVLEYTPSRVRIRVASGEIVVEGADLRIDALTPAEINVTGQVKAVRHKGPKDA